MLIVRRRQEGFWEGGFKIQPQDIQSIFSLGKWMSMCHKGLGQTEMQSFPFVGMHSREAKCLSEWEDPTEKQTLGEDK